MYAHEAESIFIRSFSKYYLATLPSRKSYYVSAQGCNGVNLRI